MKILITGSSGMIGSELVTTLESLGHEVIGVDRKQPEFSTPRMFINHDLLKPLEEVPVTPDLIIHLAANARVWELVENPGLALENVITTHNIFEYARKNKIKILTASSREVYGNNNELPVKELIGSQRKTESSYAASKLFGEAYAWAYSKSYGLDTKIVRFSNVYGKYDFSDRFIPKVIRQMKAGETVEIWGRGKVLDFTYITDAVSGLIHLIDRWNDTEFKEWNIASGSSISLLEVAGKLKISMETESKVIVGDSHPGEVQEYQADITRMRNIGWEPKVSIDEGLSESIKYYVTQPEPRA